MNHTPFVYSALVTEVYDGDTITVDIDLGFDIVMQNQKLRLFGINTPEVRGKSRPEGLESRDALRDQILHEEVLIKTHRDKKGKYGRYLGTVFFEGTNINELLVERGLAEFHDY